jgi:hypothetical protein
VPLTKDAHAIRMRLCDTDRERAAHCSVQKSLSVSDVGHQRRFSAVQEGKECAQNMQRNTTLWRFRTADRVPPLSTVTLPGSAHR